jgi:hypothetical protein
VLLSLSEFSPEKWGMGAKCRMLLKMYFAFLMLNKTFFHITASILYHPQAHIYQFKLRRSSNSFCPEVSQEILLSLVNLQAVETSVISTLIIMVTQCTPNLFHILTLLARFLVHTFECSVMVDFKKTFGFSLAYVNSKKRFHCDISIPAYGAHGSNSSFPLLFLIYPLFYPTLMGFIMLFHKCI